MIDTLRRRFGLLGRNISYSFSKGYFTEKFSDEVFAGNSYENFDIAEIDHLTGLLKNNPDLKGLNVTIPYKEQIIPFLDKLSKKAALIGAVNTIKFTKNGKLKGYNTDYYGFKKSLKPLLEPHHKKALILGTGGASKGVCRTRNEVLGRGQPACESRCCGRGPTHRSGCAILSRTRHNRREGLGAPGGRPTTQTQRQRGASREPSFQPGLGERYLYRPRQRTDAAGRCEVHRCLRMPSRKRDPASRRHPSVHTGEDARPEVLDHTST